MCRKKRVNVNLLPFMLTNERVLRDLPAQARPVSSTREHHIFNFAYKLALHVLEEMDDLTDAIRRSFFVMAEDASVFLESLYEQKHAFYFRKVREWYKFHEVCLYAGL